jgi:hypothetical protein
LLKNLRCRLANDDGGPEITFSEGVESIKSEGIAELLQGVCDIPITKISSMEKLRDDGALQLISVRNLIALAEQGEAVGALYMAPFVALAQVVRSKTLSVGSRLTLLDQAFAMLRTFRRPEALAQNRDSRFEQCFLWHDNMVHRTKNLCVCLYWAISNWAKCPEFPLGLGRIGTHSLECHFGHVRSVLRGDVRYEHFLNAQVKSIMIREIQEALNIRTYIRRFKNEGGATLFKNKNQLFVEFSKMQEITEELKRAVDRGAESIAQWCAELAAMFNPLVPFEKLPDMGSPVIGGAIYVRNCALKSE